MIGQSISHFRILEKLGEGGMGVVYRAHDTSLNRDVALKFLPHHLTIDPVEKERFVNEAQATASLPHPNIAVVYEIGEHEGQLFIAMEYVEGRTLKSVIGSAQDSPLNLAKILDIAIQICDGLAAAHGKGIVHRDIKSENIMLTPKGQAKIMDFGIAKVPGGSKLTRTGSTIGTAAYMSPEQARGEEVDHRADLFSFGVVLYEMLTGRLPFRGEHEAALIYSILNEEPQPVARFNEQASPEIEHIVAKALTKDRNERYQHADDMLADLMHERKKIDIAKSGYTTAAATAQPEPRRVRNVVVGGGVLLVAVIIMIGLYLFVPRPGQDQADGKTIAVLPFVNLSGNQQDEYFTDGMMEDILTQLSRISALKVISRTTMIQYKGTKKSLREIGKELNAGVALEGSVRRSGNRLRISSQLIDVETDNHLWAETYDREMQDVFAVQSDVAKQIANALQVQLTPQEVGRIEKHQTSSISAYDYYLKGREYYYRYTPENFRNAVKMFRYAIGVDSTYALAYAGLSDAYGYLQSRDTALMYAEKAIALNPELPEGYKSKGSAYIWRGWVRKAIAETRKAIELNPNYAMGATALGNFLNVAGEHTEAYRWHKKAISLEPTRPGHYQNLAATFSNVSMDDKAEIYLRKAIRLEPDRRAFYELLRWMYLRQKAFDKAVALTDSMVQMFPGDSGSVYQNFYCMDNIQRARGYFEKELDVPNTYPMELVYIYRKLGMMRESNEMIGRVEDFVHTQIKAGDENSVFLANLALCAYYRGKKAEAYQWLEKAYTSGYSDYRWIEVDPAWAMLREDRRVGEIVEKMKARVAEQRRQIERMEQSEG